MPHPRPIDAARWAAIYGATVALHWHGLLTGGHALSDEQMERIIEEAEAVADWEYEQRHRDTSEGNDGKKTT